MPRSGKASLTSWSYCSVEPRASSKSPALSGLFYAPESLHSSQRSPPGPRERGVAQSPAQQPPDERILNVTILLLAAGTSRRFGRDTTAQALASGLPVMVCLRPSDEELAGALQSLGAQTLLCSLAYRGMGHTLAQGLERVKQEDGVLIALGDMPHIQPASYRAVAEALCPGTITLPQCNGSTGHPVGFSREFFTELAALTGDRGARQVIGRNENAIVRVALTDTGIFTDIDSPADIT